MKAQELILKAMRADSIPAGESGLWTVAKLSINKQKAKLNSIYYKEDVLDGNYTFLFRYTLEKLHQRYGDCVMEDTIPELQTHLNFILKAQGRVLVTGLGLGCVVRGLLTKRSINKITVVERDQDVLDLVLPYMPNDNRLQVIKADAFDFLNNNNDIYDFAWHDLWADTDINEPKLPLIHSRLMKNGANKIKQQGAWGMPREIITALKRRSFWYEAAPKGM